MSFFKNENYRIFNPSIHWMLSEKINYEKLLINQPELFINFTPSPITPKSQPNNNNNNNININKNNLISHVFTTNNIKSTISGTIEVYNQDSLAPNIVKSILSSIGEPKSENVLLLFDLLLKLESFFIKKHSVQLELFKYFFKDFKPFQSSGHSRENSRDNSLGKDNSINDNNGSFTGNSNLNDLKFYENISMIWEYHSSAYSNLHKIVSSNYSESELLEQFKKFYQDVIVYNMNSIYQDVKSSFLSTNRYIILLNESVQEKIPALKFFYHCLSHFWVFTDLIDQIFKSLFGDDKNISSILHHFRDQVLKKFKKLKSDKLLPKYSNTNFILRFSTDNPKYPTIEFQNDKVTIHQPSILKSLTFYYHECSIRYKYQFYNENNTISGNEENLYNFKKNSSLVFISKSFKFQFSSKQINNHDILNIFGNIVQYRDLVFKRCNICRFDCYSTKKCDNCSQLVCDIDSHPIENLCLNCILLNPIEIIASYFDRQEQIHIFSQDFKIFNTTIYKAFNLPKGSLFNYVFSEAPNIPIENIYNLMLLKRELDELRKQTILIITMRDPVINVKTIPGTAMTNINSQIRDGNKGGSGSVSRVIVDPKYLPENTPPLVFKKLKLSQVNQMMPEESIEFNNSNMERCRYEASFIADLCIKSKYIIAIYGFCENPLGLFLEEAPLGSINKKFFKSWELFLLCLIDICKGMRDVHANGIIHRDLKPDNILMFSESLVYSDIRCKIADFGISTTMQKPHNLQHTGAQRTPYYCAPEHDRRGNYTELVDVYTFGLTVFNMLTGQKFINQFGQVVCRLGDYKWFPLEITQLINITTQINPNDRPRSFQEILTKIETFYHDKIYLDWPKMQPLAP